MFARRSHFGITQRGAMHIMGVCFVRRTSADDGLAANQRGLVGDCLACLDGRINRFRIMPLYFNNVPTVGLKTLRCVIGEPSVHMAVN